MSSLRRQERQSPALTLPGSQRTKGIASNRAFSLRPSLSCFFLLEQTPGLSTPTRLRTATQSTGGWAFLLSGLLPCIDNAQRPRRFRLAAQMIGTSNWPHQRATPGNCQMRCGACATGAQTVRQNEEAPGRLSRRGRVVFRGTLGGSNDDHAEIHRREFRRNRGSRCTKNDTGMERVTTW
jgi:hypothetical protein